VKEEIDFPRDIDFRLLNVFTTDIDERVKDITVLLALQESELALLWFSMFALTLYVVWKGKK